MMGRLLLPTADRSVTPMRARVPIRSMFRCVITRIAPGAASAAAVSRRVIRPRVTVLWTRLA